MTAAVEMSAADTALKAIQVDMGVSVSILQHLPSDKIRLEPFDDNKRERPNMMPVRMLFGHIKEGKDKDYTVWILLQKDHAAERSPEQRFNVFDRFGVIQGQIGADEAVRRTNAVTAFKCLKTSGVIEMDQLRAVIKYYFIVKRVTTPWPWLVGAHFMKSLRAACVVAKLYKTKAVANLEKEKGRDPAAQNVYGIRPSVPRHDDGSSVKVNEQLLAATPSIVKARRTPQHPNPQRAPTAPMIPSNQAASDLFIPEGPHIKDASEASANKARNKTPDEPMMPKAMRAPPSHPLPQPVTANRSHSATVNDARSFLIHSDSEEADNNSATMDISRSASARTESMEVLGERSLNSHSSDDFVPAYRKAIDDRYACKEKIKVNKEEQKGVWKDIDTLQAKMADLKKEERKLREEDRLAGVAKKRLRESLSEKERALFIFGAELAERELKRPRKGTKSEEDTSGDEV